jgi:hypothetical protein
MSVSSRLEILDWSAGIEFARTVFVIVGTVPHPDPTVRLLHGMVEPALNVA